MANAEPRAAKSPAALQTLERSLARLERALANRKTELALAADVAEARSDYEKLAGAARGVEARLAGVRERLQDVLGN
jgi:hypothetical protein